MVVRAPSSVDFMKRVMSHAIGRGMRRFQMSEAMTPGWSA